MNSIKDMKKNNPTELNAHFEFGENWKNFLNGVNEEKINAAARDIEQFLGKNEINGKVFIDIGCGSGLSSLAAYRLGASEVYSYDIDPLNVDNVSFLKSKFAVPGDFPWYSKVKSIVEDRDLKDLKCGDIVYSWGVLHHTGDMWKAIKNTISLVNKDGIIYLMLYRNARLARFWKMVKRIYVNSPRPVKFFMRNSFASILIAGIMAKGKNPIKSIRNYGLKSRGMSWYTDITDWIGGYPFEYAEAEEVISYFEDNGFELIRIRPEITRIPWGLWGTGSYQYIFKNKNNKVN